MNEKISAWRPCMKIERSEPETLPCSRGLAATIRIRSFKGRKDVLVHLFRPVWDNAEMSAHPWSELIDQNMPSDQGANRGDSREVVLESFSATELHALVSYLSNRYADRLTDIATNALTFPLPAGLLPLSSMPEGKDIGRIRFEIVPGYPLSFPVHGLYDLSQHKPMVQENLDND